MGNCSSYDHSFDKKTRKQIHKALKLAVKLEKVVSGIDEKEALIKVKNGTNLILGSLNNSLSPS